MNAFFDIYSELSQVYFFVVTSLEVPGDHHTTSTDFDRVKMFYGNCYEQFTHLVEFLALVNNMLVCRRYNKFQELTLEQYRKLDRPARFGPFEANKPFMVICAEADNRIRNASHHGSFELDPDQIIRYRHSDQIGRRTPREVATASSILNNVIACRNSRTERSRYVAYEIVRSGPVPPFPDRTGSLSSTRPTPTARRSWHSADS